jgi:hypothetical protein
MARVNSYHLPGYTKKKPGSKAMGRKEVTVIILKKYRSESLSKQAVKRLFKLTLSCLNCIANIQGEMIIIIST